MSINILSCLSDAIAKEQQHKNTEFIEKMRKPLNERIARGYTLCNFSIDIEFYDGAPNPFCPPINNSDAFIKTVTIHCRNENISKLREGTSVILSNGVYRFKMLVAKDGIRDMILESKEFDVKNNYINLTNYPREGWEINEQNLDVNQQLLMSSWEYISSHEDIRNNLTKMLNGNINNTYSNNCIEHTDNPSQDEAVQKALSCSDFHIIQGPPGTGKTYTIARIVKNLISKGKNVFISASTHTAINNCLNSISKLVREPDKIVKIGERYQAEEIIDNGLIVRKQRLPYSKYISSGLSQQGVVVGATPFALCYPKSKKLEGWPDFDYVIIDEAAQMSMPLAIAAIIHGKKSIFVGDHQQLDPIIPSGTGNPLLSKSIFKHLIDLYPSMYTLLNLSYRLSPSLIRIPSELFYDGRITSAKKDNKKFLQYNCRNCAEILQNESNEILFLHEVYDGLGRSIHEADIIADIVKTLLDNGVSKDDMALITPYRAQVREIKRNLVDRGIVDDDNLNDIFIDTIERMQGQERDYVVFSLANCNPIEIEERLEFFYSANRLNVAITRAKIKCIVLAHRNIFDICHNRIIDNQSFSLKVGVRSYTDFYKLSTKVFDKVTDEEW